MMIKSKGALETIRYSANGIFFFVSGLISVNMFIQFNENPWIKIVLGLLGVGLELARYYAFINGKANWILLGKRVQMLWFTVNEKRVNAVVWFIIYSGLATVVIIASYGFSATALESQSKATEAYITQKDSIISDYSELSDRIVGLVNQEKQLTNYNWKYQELEDKLTALKKQRDALKNSLTNFSETKINVQKTMFESIGKGTSKTPEAVKFFLLVLIAILLEVSLMATSLDIDLSDEKKEEKPQHNSELKDWLKKNKVTMFSYIDGMMDIKYGLKRLNGNKYIQDNKGVSEPDCVMCKSIIQKIKVGDKFLITTVQGSSEANFTKEEMKKAITNLIGE